MLVSGSAVKNLSAVQELWEMWVQSLGGKDPLEEEMTAYSSILAWEIPRTEGARRAIHGVAWSQTRLKQLSTHVLNKNYNKNFFEACPFFIKNKCICIWS